MMSIKSSCVNHYQFYIISVQVELLDSVEKDCLSFFGGEEVSVFAGNSIRVELTHE